jgi:hypothetical protein
MKVINKTQFLPNYSVAGGINANYALVPFLIPNPYKIFIDLGKTINLFSNKKQYIMKICYEFNNHYEMSKESGLCQRNTQ